MNIFEMMRNGELSPLVLVIPIEMLIVSFLCYFLGKNKKMNSKLAFLIGLVPIVNGVALLYYIFCSRKK